MDNKVSYEQRILKTESLLEDRVYENMYQNTDIEQSEVVFPSHWFICDESIAFTDFLVKKMRKFKKTDVETVTIWKYWNVDRTNEFLKVSLIRRISNFTAPFDRITTEKYILDHLPRVTKSLCLSYCNIDEKQLVKIIQVGRHIEDIKFQWCIMKPKEFKLNKSLHYTIKSIEFTADLLLIRDEYRKSVKDLGQGIKSFVEAALLTDLKQSLNSVKLYAKGKQYTFLTCEDH
ncbi:unnamed protein product [Moneuplotes crassus]|uniref:Uncharacterized protein n=1 Tax=Euplotes crassus TaxID=5936 RepID=A0AAD1XWF0_EUPCR|nr:unnamed protein product [Moneuplotes crassus]